MEILWLDRVDSTQRYLLDALKNSELRAPACVGTSLQTEGKGSRGNEWIGTEGNLFVSIALARKMLPEDLRLESSSIYFAFLMKDLLDSMGSKVWLKWPNDFYMEDKKIGGVITNLAAETLVCGIGINLVNAPEEFGTLDIDISPYNLTEHYAEMFKKLPSWKQIFSKFKLEFELSREFSTHQEKKKIVLKDAVLLDDGSLECNGQRIFSLR